MNHSLTVAQSLPGARAETTFDDDGYPPMAATDASRGLLAKLNRINRDLRGHGAANDGTRL